MTYSLFDIAKPDFKLPSAKPERKAKEWFPPKTLAWVFCSIVRKCKCGETTTSPSSFAKVCLPYNHAVPSVFVSSQEEYLLEPDLPKEHHQTSMEVEFCFSCFPAPEPTYSNTHGWNSGQLVIKYREIANEQPNQSAEVRT